MLGGNLPSHMFAEYASLRMGQHSVGQLLLTLPVHSHHLHLVHCVPNKLEPICRGKSAQQALDACASHLCTYIRLNDAGNKPGQGYLGNPVEEEDVDLCPASGVERGKGDIIWQVKRGQNLS